MVAKANNMHTSDATHRAVDDFEHLSRECFWEMDGKLRYTYVSKRFSEMTGIPCTIAIGLTNDDLGLTIPDREDSLAHQVQLRRYAAFQDAAFSYVHPDGRELRISANGEALYDQSGAFCGYRGSARQIDCNSGVVTVHPDTQSFYKLVGNFANLGFWEWDAIDDKCIYCSEEAAKLHGLTVDEYLAQVTTLEGSSAFVHPVDRPAYVESLAKYIADPARVEIEVRLLAGDDKVRHVRQLLEPVFDDSNRHIRTVGLLQDNSASKKAATTLDRARNERDEGVVQRTEELLLVEERLHELGANAREVLYVLSADWQQVIYVNKAFEHIWGHSCQAVIENPSLWIDSIHPDDRGMVVSEIHEKSASDEWDPNFSDCRVIGADGEVRWLSTRVYPIRDSDDAIVRLAGVAEDVTERKEATDALHQIQKMDALGQLTGGAAHDFNNLLAVILGNARLLEGRVAADDEISLRDIIAAGDRGAELTNRLLAFSRLQPLQPKPTDVTKLAMDIGGLLRRTLGATISVDILSSCGTPIALVDSALLQNAILNLSLNARDAMPSGGRLTIRVEDSDPIAAVPRQAGGAGQSQALQIVIQDNGIGMSVDVLSRSLEPFFTTKVPSEGSGLGLPMVYGFVKQSNGDLAIESKPGEGTTVTIRFPRIVGDGVSPESRVCNDATN